MSNFLRTESEKILMEALKSSDNSSGRNILRDDDDSWYKIPYQITFGEKFNTVKEDILFRTQNLTGIDGVNNIGVRNPESINSSYVSSVFGLDGDTNTLTMLDKAYYQDTRVGSNDALNCLWQFNRDDDILHNVSVVSTHSGTKIGLSRVYSNTTQTNQQIAYFTFGVPYYSSILHFHKNAFDEKLITINQQGYDSDEGSKKLGELFGEGLVLLVAIRILPFKLFYEISKKSANNYKINRFYELRGRMQLYYKYVDSMLAHWLVASGLYGNNLSIVGLSDKLVADPNCLPLALRLTGASIWEIVARKAVNAGVYIYDKKKRAKIIEESLYGVKATPLRYRAEKDSRIKFSAEELASGMDSVANNTLYSNAEQSMYAGTASDQESLYAQQVMSDTAQFYTNKINKLGFTHKDETLAYEDDHGSWQTVFAKSALGATQFIGFRVDKSTDASESFSNSTSPSAFAENFNAKVKEVASQSIDMGIKGASADDSWVGSLVEDIKSIGVGILEGLKAIDFIGLTDLANAVMTGAFIDIPEQYSGSDFNKSHSLSFQLRSPYGDKVSIYQSIIVPLFCILAGALPRAGGANSYVQPFLCRVYCKGMFAIPMGIIDSISIKRGDSEFGWTYDNIPTCVDVNISIKDMSPIMYMMINDAAFSDILGSDSAFNEYLLTLSGVGLFERISQIQRVLRGMIYTAHTVRNRYFNPVYWSHSVSQYSPIQFVASFIPRSGINNN